MIMKMLFKFAYRNVLRNKKRSLLTAVSIFFAALISAFAIGFVNGLISNFVGNSINYQTGNLKVTTQGYVQLKRFMPVDEVLAEADRIGGQIAALPGVDSVEKRIPFGILLGKDDQSVAAVGMGLDLENSRFGLKDMLKTGTLDKTGGIYIGTGLAAKLGVKMGEELLLATKTSEGGLNGIKLQVKGLISTGIGMFDRQFFFISLNDAARLLKIKSGSTELLVFTKKDADANRLKREVQKLLPAGIAVQTPSEQMGSFFDLILATKYIYYFIDLLILFLASFVIVNTMMMSVFERMWEIGTLKALGMTDQEIFLNFTFEGMIIGGMGGVAGGILGYILVIYLSFKGIDYSSSLGSLDFPMKMIIYPSIGLESLIATIIMAVAISTLSAMIPARHARKLMPAEAIRKL